MASKNIEIMPTGEALGAEVRGVDIRSLSVDTFKQILEAWHKYQVLVIRNQILTDPELIAYAKLFGNIQLPRKSLVDKDPWIPEHPEILVVSNLKDAKGNALGALGAGEAMWHADMTYLEEVPLGSILYAIEIPMKDGETSFCNQRLALETLPQELKEKINGRKLIHDHAHNSTGAITSNWTEQMDPMDTPGARHPIAVDHHTKKYKHLFLGRRPHAYIVGLSLDESEDLLNKLWAHATQEKFSWSHEWKVGDVVLWDNWSTLHHRNPFDESKRRIMHRTQIEGIKPS